MDQHLQSLYLHILPEYHLRILLLLFLFLRKSLIDLLLLFIISLLRKQLSFFILNLLFLLFLLLLLLWSLFFRRNLSFQMQKDHRIGQVLLLYPKLLLFFIIVLTSLIQLLFLIIPRMDLLFMLCFLYFCLNFIILLRHHLHLKVMSRYLSLNFP